MPGAPWTTDPCKVDEQGRTIIPKEIRQELGIVGPRGHVVYEVKDGAVQIRRVMWSKS